MKKGLKRIDAVREKGFSYRFKCRPDEEGIETSSRSASVIMGRQVSNADLMKKGLKQVPKHDRAKPGKGFKCRPDEEGIETPRNDDPLKTNRLRFKCRPDEEGIETTYSRKLRMMKCRFKCRPDEEGIETEVWFLRWRRRRFVSNADLMKKGLKPRGAARGLRGLGFKCRPDEEGIETSRRAGQSSGAYWVSNADLMKKGLKPGQRNRRRRVIAEFQMQT